MERDYTDGKENVYLTCRKKAAKYNDKLNSREMAAELLGFSTSTLANYELGVTKNVPPDSVVMMSDLYKQPELKNYYCKHECPIGKNFPLAVKEMIHRAGFAYSLEVYLSSSNYDNLHSSNFKN